MIKKFHEAFENLGATLREGLGVSRSFGEPIEIEGKKIIPVAEVRLHGGGGEGQGIHPGKDPGKASKEEPPSGGGMGFLSGVKPIGYITVEDDQVNWVRIRQWGRTLLLFALLSVIGVYIVSRQVAKVRISEAAGGYG